MNKEQFIQELDDGGYSYRLEDDWIVVYSQAGKNHDHFIMDHLTTIPGKVEFSNNGDVDLNSLIDIGRVRFKNKGNVDLSDLETLSNLSGRVQLKNDGMVYLNSLKKLPKTFEFNNHGDVYLLELKNIDGVKFHNAGKVYAPHLTGKHFYDGEEREFLHADTFTMIVLSRKTIEGAEIIKCAILCGGNVDKLDKYYIAIRNGIEVWCSTEERALKMRTERLDRIQCVAIAPLGAE